jgi:flavoprotein
MPETGRTAWAITGSGHYLRECIALFNKLDNTDLYLSRAASEVLHIYGYDIKELQMRHRVFRDTTASATPVGRFYEGVYDHLIVAPATSNTVAKMVCGISDTLVTNIYAQAGKCRITCTVFACDAEPEVQTEAPNGIVTVYPRAIDLENTRRLSKFEYTRVVTRVEQLEQTLGVNTACDHICSL